MNSLLMRSKLRWGIFALLLISSCFSIDNSSVVEVEKTEDPRYKKLIYSNKKGVNEFGNLFGDVSISYNNKSTEIDVCIYRNSNSELEVALPSDWRIVYDKFLLSAIIGNNGMDYFSIIKHNKLEIGLNYEEYFDFVKKTLLTSNIEKNIDSRQNEYQIHSKKVYNLNGYTQLDRTIFAFHAYYLDSSDSIYDISMRYEKKDGDEINKVIFEMVAKSLVINDKRPLFEEGKSSKTFNVSF